jgi:endonuclease YncB( thermonuclease family)
MAALVCIILLITSTALAADGRIYADRVSCSFIRAYDGDTITASIPAWPDIVGKNISVRIFGIDTPEIRGTSGTVKQTARNAKRMTESLCRKADVLELRNIRRDKYFRLLADVWADGKSIADILIKNGLARPYSGGKKEPWE